MDPVFLATVTSAATHLALEVINGAASEAGVSLWQKIAGKLGIHPDTAKEDLAPAIAGKLQPSQELAAEIVSLLRQSGAGNSHALVGRIEADKVTVIGTVNVANGPFVIN